jgi:hypothetical protein
MAKSYKPIPRRSAVQAERFWRKVDRTRVDGCWPWNGAVFRLRGAPRGQARINGTLFYASRVAYFVATGVDPGERLVCHTCDNPLCVNPNHLFLGSHNDNIADMVRKGRGSGPFGRGEASNSHKLTDEMVRAIRRACGTRREIAERFGVSQPTVSGVVNRVRWSHVA